MHIVYNMLIAIGRPSRSQLWRARNRRETTRRRWMDEDHSGLPPREGRAIRPIVGRPIRQKPIPPFIRREVTQVNDNRYSAMAHGLAIALALFLAGGSALADEAVDDKVVLDLAGSWEMEGVLPGEGVKKLFHKVHPDCGPAFVPGDVYTDLWRVGRIDDPHVGRNGQRAKWVMDYEWWYFKTFKVPPEMKGKQIRLMFEGVDYECDVWLNGEALGNHQGAYSRFHFDVSDRLRFSTDRDRTENNLLAIRLAPPPRTFALVCGRKYRWHGDYGNNVTPFGIWRPVRLEATGPVSIEDIYVQSDLGRITRQS